MSQEPFKTIFNDYVKLAFVKKVKFFMKFLKVKYLVFLKML